VPFKTLVNENFKAHINFLNHNKDICKVSIPQDEYYVFVKNTGCNQEERMKNIQTKKDRAKLANIK
jgi:hypothetical protein